MVLFSDTPHISSEIPTQCTSTLAVAGAAVTAVSVLLVVAVVQSAIIWHQRRSAPAFNDCHQWSKSSEEDFLSKTMHWWKHEHKTAEHDLVAHCITDTSHDF